MRRNQCPNAGQPDKIYSQQELEAAVSEVRDEYRAAMLKLMKTKRDLK